MAPGPGETAPEVPRTRGNHESNAKPYTNIHFYIHPDSHYVESRLRFAIRAKYPQQNPRSLVHSFRFASTRFDKFGSGLFGWGFSAFEFCKAVLGVSGRRN
jgi:hypothetical protein